METAHEGWLSQRLDRLPPDFIAHVEAGAPRLFFHGYYRLLGMGNRSPYDLATWNEPECWKFAWHPIAAPFLCVGFSVWGDQYAYDLRSPDKGIVQLEAYDLHAEPIARSWTELVDGELGRLDHQPYDERVLDAFETWGPLDWEDGLALVPPLLLADSEGACQVVKTNMRSLMIMNGDVHNQLQAMPEGARIAGVSTYTDDLGRERMRLERWPAA